MNIASLRAFSAILQRSIEIGDQFDISEWELREAASTASCIARFRAGEGVNLLVDGGFRSAVTEAEIFEHVPIPLRNDDDLDRLRQVAALLKPADVIPAAIYYDLVNEEHFKDHRYGEGWKTNTVWHVGLSANEWFVVDGNEGDGSAGHIPPVRSYLTIRVSKIIRDLWAEHQ